MSRTPVWVLLAVTLATALDKPRLGGSVENQTALHFNRHYSFTDVATVRLEGSWEFAAVGAVETHLLLSAALRPLDPFALMREESALRRILSGLLAVAAGPADSIMALEMAGLDPATQAWLAAIAGTDLQPFIRHLPYSSFWPRNTFTLDRAVVKLFFQRFDIHVGRQVAAWGTGYGWNPTDVWNVKNPADPTAPKAGINALRLEIPFGPASGLSAVICPGSDIDRTSVGVRVKVHAGRFDFSLCGIRVMSDNAALLKLPVRITAGADMAGELGDIGVWGECAVVNPVHLGGDYLSFDSLYMQANAGLNHTFDNGLFLMGEYYFNGLGRSNPHNYGPADLLRMLGGSMPGFGRHYVMVGGSQTVLDNWNLGLFAVGNLSDFSLMVLPEVEYDFRGSIALKLSAALAFGDRKQSEYGGLHHSVGLTATGWF